MSGRLNSSQKIRSLWLLAGLLILGTRPAFADINSDEDETFYEMIVEFHFKRFQKKHGRFPKTWIELKVQDSCSGYQVDDWKHFPKAHEAIIWRPSHCELHYKIVSSGKSNFKVVALAKGHVVSVYENFRATYFKTPYHDHGPYPGEDGKGGVY